MIMRPLRWKELMRPYYLKWVYANLCRGRYPSQFADCWKYPHVDVGPEARSFCFPESAGSEILMLSAADWHTRIQRSQHLARQFARRGHRVYYLNPHLGREFAQPYPFSPRCVVSAPDTNIVELHVHLCREPVYHERALLPREERTVVDAILQLIDITRSRPAAVLVSFPIWAGVAISIARAVGCRLIYDCHDLWAGFGNTSEDILAQEPLLFARSDTVLFSAEWLKQHFEATSPGLRLKSLLVRNAVEPDDFPFVMKRENRKTVTIAYVGSLNFWFDYDAVAHAARRHPEWLFKLVGRVETPEARRLRSLKNVVFHGEIPYPLLARYLRDVDVCTIPFRTSPLTLATNPIKLYEYLACGHPIVSTRLPEVRRLGRLVGIADDPHSFVHALEEAVRTGDEGRRERRRIAEAETWQARCDSIVPSLCRAPATSWVSASSTGILSRANQCELR